jgi:hypothetical protein
LNNYILKDVKNITENLALVGLFYLGKLTFKSIRRIYSKSFAKKIRNCKNIYSKSNPSKAITKKLIKINLSKIKIKKFQDI